MTSKPPDTVFTLDDAVRLLKIVDLTIGRRIAKALLGAAVQKGNLVEVTDGWVLGNGIPIPKKES